MSTIDEKSVVVHTVNETPISANVLTINRALATRQQPTTIIDVPTTIQDYESTRSMTPPQSAHHEKSMIETSPYNLLSKSQSKENITRSNSGFDTDIEALAQQKTEAGCSKTGLVAIRSKCQSTSNAWPSRTEQKRMIKQRKQNKAYCGCWAAMTRLQRNIIKVVCLLVLIGLIIGLCVGVTRAVNGSVFHPN